MEKHPVILAQMTHKEHPSWSPKQKHTDKRLLRNTAFLAAVSLCLGLYAWFSITNPQKSQAVMSHISTGFEYDETLGKLQLVNNMLPASAMVFLSNDSSIQDFQAPVPEQVSHAWTQQEPWFEYASIGDVSACQAGEIITIVKNNVGSHTMRILHSDGYESVYSGLRAVHVKEHDTVSKGQVIGTAAGNAAFELRRDGVSVLPVFSEIRPMRIKFHPTFAVYLFCITLLSSYTSCLSILLALIVHETFHYIACCLTGEQIERLEITPFGGVMTYKRGTCPHKGVKGIIVNAAGPIGNYLVLLCISLLNVQRFVNLQFFHSLMISNASMLLLNLLPALPLDGGQIVFCLGYYFFPIAKLVHYLSKLGTAVGIAGIILAAYGLLRHQLLNCSLLIVSIYMIFSAKQSQKTLLAENICAVVHERLSNLPRIQHIEQYRVASNTSLYELIPYLKEGYSVSFYFPENKQYLELTEYAFCHALCVCASLSVKEAYHRFSLYCEKTPKNAENTSFPS